MPPGADCGGMLGRARLSRHLCRDSTRDSPGGARLSALKLSSDYTPQPSTPQIAPQRLVADRIAGTDPQLVVPVTVPRQLRADIEVASLTTNQLDERDPRRVAALLEAEEHRPEHRRRHVLENELRILGAQPSGVADAGHGLLV